MTMQFSFDATLPIYQQIIDEFKRALARGELRPGDKLPSQRDLAQVSKVNPNTVQRAYREMEAMGMVESSRGMGTFICSDTGLLTTIRTEMAEEAVRRFVQEMMGLGLRSEEILALTESTLQAAAATIGESGGRREAE
ncbi:MAG: GntR family transcriptional regulator [Mycobacterium leprae]